MTPRAVLVGPPGAGKTTVGRLLAERLGVQFRDTDEDVERAFGASVADVFVSAGEEAFRAAEARAVAAALSESDGVVALGGGSVLDPGTRTLLADHRVVLLSVGLGDAMERIGMGASRPVLALNPRATLRYLMEQRAPLYAQVPRVTVNTDGRSAAQVTDAVLAQLS